MKWTYPNKNVVFLKMEIFIILLIGSIIFFLSLLAREGLIFAAIFTLLFLLIYAVVGYLLKQIFQIEHSFELTKSHLHIKMKSRFSKEHQKIPLKQILKHKIDGFFLDGYAVSKKGKHLLYFNSKKEHKDFVKHLKKHGKKK
tara:strand:+ start:65 stop:490 length:426 start_codon:yes stop_codon:yes gene_type:complete